MYINAFCSSYAVAEFQQQYYSPSDLQQVWFGVGYRLPNPSDMQFFQASVPYDPKGYTVNHVIGQNDGTNPGVEANLGIRTNLIINVYVPLVV